MELEEEAHHVSFLSSLASVFAVRNLLSYHCLVVIQSIWLLCVSVCLLIDCHWEYCYQVEKWSILCSNIHINGNNPGIIPFQYCTFLSFLLYYCCRNSNSHFFNIDVLNNRHLTRLRIMSQETHQILFSFILDYFLTWKGYSVSMFDTHSKHKEIVNKWHLTAVEITQKN